MARSPRIRVAYGGGFDLGRMNVRGKNGEAVLGVYNEFMTADFAASGSPRSRT